MCDVLSRIESSGKIWFVNSKQVKKYLREHPEKQWADLGGHHGIRLIYPDAPKDTRGDKEGFPAPIEMNVAINSGQLDELHRNAHRVYFRVNDDGQLEGPYQSWHGNGLLREETTYLNGLYAGSYQSWYDNGQLREESAYVNGQLEGPYRCWHDNGQLREESAYVN